MPPASLDGAPSQPPGTGRSARPAALELRGLTKRYGDRTAVDALTFDVPAGTVCGFIGPNGAGKTTTIRMLLGLITPTSGTATVLGHPIAEPSSYLPRVGAMIEGPAFYPTLSGRRNLEVLARLARVPGGRVDDVLDAVDMTSRAGEPFRAYSLGMKQRIGLAAALLKDPDVLILDEPTNGLDPPGIREVRDLLRSLADTGRTVLVSSHLLDELQQVIDHAVIISGGTSRFDGTLPELMATQRRLLRARPERAGDLLELAAICKRAGVDADMVGEDIVLEAIDGGAGWLNRLAMNHGITLISLTTTAPRLEDVFFDLTDRADP